MTNTFTKVQSKAQLQRTLQKAQLVFYYQNMATRNKQHSELMFHLHHIVSLYTLRRE
jgi:hypothetical protein